MGNIFHSIKSRFAKMEGTAYMEEPRAASGTEEGVDSDREEDAREQKESAFEITYDVDSLAGALTDGGKVVVCNAGTPQALVKIIMDSDLSQIGTIKVTNLKDGKTEEAATLHSAKGIVFFFVTSHLGSNHCGQIVDKIYASIAQKNCTIVGLNTIYK